jgi:hypothetical protein
MSRPLLRCLTIVGLLAVGCIDPTAACSCTLTAPTVVVTGRVIDQADAPVAGAHVRFDGVPLNRSVEPPFRGGESATTDATGAFMARASSQYPDDEQAVRAAIVPASSSDTIRLRVGAGRFRLPEHLDTVRVTIRLP